MNLGDFVAGVVASAVLLLAGLVVGQAIEVDQVTKRAECVERVLRAERAERRPAAKKPSGLVYHYESGSGIAAAVCGDR